jgi:5-methyltetrahydrofolate--homocysteine methyltransferase
MTRDSFRKEIEERIRLFDGAMGTELLKRGLAAGEAPESWNLSRSEDVQAVHGAYAKAGSDVLTTNSFGGSRIKLARYGLENKTSLINCQAAALAVREARNGLRVAGSIGPTGEFLEPLGTLKPDVLRDVFREQAEALLDGGADFILVETMSDLGEARTAVEAVLGLGDVPVVACMTFLPSRVGFRTMMGVSPRQAAFGLVEAGADGIGANCGSGIDHFIPIIREIRSLTDRPILAQPNAGLPRLEAEQTVYPETAQDMARRLSELVEAGAKMVGGCCGTTPEHIRMFRSILDGTGS